MVPVCCPLAGSGSCRTGTAGGARRDASQDARYRSAGPSSGPRRRRLIESERSGEKAGCFLVPWNAARIPGAEPAVSTPGDEPIRDVPKCPGEGSPHQRDGTPRSTDPAQHGQGGVALLMQATGIPDDHRREVSRFLGGLERCKGLPLERCESKSSMAISVQAPCDALFTESAFAVIENDGGRTVWDGRGIGHAWIIRGQCSRLGKIGIHGRESGNSDALGAECDRFPLNCDARGGDEPGIDGIDSSGSKFPGRVGDSPTDESTSPLRIEVISLHQEMFQRVRSRRRHRLASGPVNAS